MSDLTFAVSEDTVVDIFGVMRDQFEFTESDSTDSDRLTAGYDAVAELRRGSVDLRPPNEVRVEELDVHWRRLNVSLGVDIRSLCVGGGCIVQNLFGSGCVRAPEICLFERDPDINFDLDLSNDRLTSEITFTAELLVEYLADRPPGVSYLKAQELEENRAEDDPHKINRWGVFLNPEEVDIDIIDIADTVGNIIDDAIDAVLSRIFSGFDPWVRDAIESIVGPLVDYIRELLDIKDDIQEWISDILGQSLGLFNVIVEAVADFLLAEPILPLEDPYPILQDSSDPLIPVKIPIEAFAIEVSDTELVVTGSVGGTP